MNSSCQIYRGKFLYHSLIKLQEFKRLFQLFLSFFLKPMRAISLLIMPKISTNLCSKLLGHYSVGDEIEGLQDCYSSTVKCFSGGRINLNTWNPKP